MLMEKASERREFRPTIPPKGGRIILQIPSYFPLWPHGGKWGKTLTGALHCKNSVKHHFLIDHVRAKVWLSKNPERVVTVLSYIIVHG